MFKRLEEEEGFTLIEVIIVIVIIGFLATTVGPNLFNRVTEAKQKTASNQLDIFELALDNYRLDNGQFPTTEQGLKALVEEPTTAPRPNNWSGPYLDKKKVPKDPWGYKYHYQYPGKHNDHKYDIWTLGGDNKEGGSGENADVHNW